MGKKSAPAPPPVPDPVATANAQGEVNRETAITQANLNRINQTTPQGTLTYNQIGTFADGTPQYEQVMQYSPEQQAIYDQQNQVSQALSGLANDNIDRVAGAQNSAFNFDGFTPLQNINVGGAPQLQSSIGDAGGVQSTFGTGGPLTANVSPTSFQSQIANAGDLVGNAQSGEIQGSLDFGNIAQILQGQDFAATSQQASDAMYNQAASRLDPQYQQLQNDLRTRLTNSGIAEGSEAYNREMDNFARQRTDAYNQANFSSIAAGLAAQQQGFGQSLATRQQGVNEVSQQGAFANSSQQQGFNQSLQNAALNNQAQGQLFGQNAAQLDAFNSAQGNEFQQGFINAQLNNAAQGQQFQQNASSAAFGNQAQDQQFQQNLANGTFTNTALSQQNQMDINNQVTGATFNNDIRQREIEEAAYLRNLPLNEIATLLGTSGGVQAPTFGPVSQVGVAAPDLMGATYDSYNAQYQNYQAAQQARSSGLGSIFGLAGSLGSALIMSDERMKHSVRKVGQLANGIATYVFSYVGSKARQFGVMAQEVEKLVPQAVNNDWPVKRVNYRELSL